MAVPPSASARLPPPAFTLPADAVGGALLVRLRLIATAAGGGSEAPAFDDVFSFGIVAPDVLESSVTAPLLELANLPRTTLAVSFSAAGGGAATVVNTGAAIALFVKLTPLDASGDRVGFAAFEDSFFVLEPGERRSVAVLGRAESCVAVAVEAWNAPPARSEPPL